MMYKLATAFITGVLFTFFLDFFYILGLFLNYIRAQDIDIYYNVLFADHQSFFLFFTAAAFFGYLFIYFPSTKIAVALFAFSLALVNLTQIPSIGKSAGEMMFSEKNKIISSGKQTYIGTLVYEGRKRIWFYDDELQEIIIIEKDELND